MSKKLASLGLAAAIGLGGLGVAAANPLGVAGAQTSTEAPSGTSKAHPDGPLQRALDKLVADGTLTQAQADKVLSTTKAEAKAGKDKRQARRGELLKVAADAIGVSTDDLKAGLKDGQSIAAQAEAKGVSRQKVDDALTKAITDRIDQAVADGKLTEEQAAKAKARMDKAVDRILDATPRGGAGRGGRFRPGN
ncbi:MAG: hypothetical protein U0P45_02775 [Acidimicrobiales bacterium]